MDIVGYTLIVIGLVFVSAGLVGIYRFDSFYARVLSSADIDTIGLITVLMGVVCINGLTWFSLKVIVVLAVLLFLNPVVTSAIVNSAYYSGYKLKKDD